MKNLMELLARYRRSAVNTSQLAPSPYESEIPNDVPFTEYTCTREMSQDTVYIVINRFSRWIRSPETPRFLSL